MVVFQGSVDAPQHIGRGGHQPVGGLIQSEAPAFDEFLYKENPPAPVAADIAALTVFQKAAGRDAGAVQVFAQRRLLLGMVDLASGRKLHHHLALPAADKIGVGACTDGGMLGFQRGESIQALQQLIHGVSSLAFWIGQMKYIIIKIKSKYQIDNYKNKGCAAGGLAPGGTSGYNRPEGMRC